MRNGEVEVYEGDEHASSKRVVREDPVESLGVLVSPLADPDEHGVLSPP